jgi:3-oxoadipate enol-lactonase / 4-carboxymuconolactone decarboxylase
MPFTTNQDARIYWRLQGDDDKPAMVLLNSIATDQTLYDPVVPALMADFRLLRIDTRGHGASDATPGDYDLDLLACDVLAVMDAAGIERAIFCGLSLGGMMSMAVALKAPGRVAALLLACTSAEQGGEFWTPRINAVREKGTASIADAAISRLYSAAFAQANKALIDTARFEISTMSDEGYAGCGAAIRAMDFIPRLGEIAVPTLVIAGTMDTATPFEGHGDRIAAGIRDAKVALIAAGHLASIENPDAFVEAIREFAAARLH